MTAREQTASERSQPKRWHLAYLESLGIRVLLFENRVELLEMPDYVVGVIRSAVLGQPPRLRQ